MKRIIIIIIYVLSNGRWESERVREGEGVRERSKTVYVCIYVDVSERERPRGKNNTRIWRPTKCVRMCAYHSISATPRVGYSIYFMYVDTMINENAKEREMVHTWQRRTVNSDSVQCVRTRTHTRVREQYTRSPDDRRAYGLDNEWAALPPPNGRATERDGQ